MGTLEYQDVRIALLGFGQEGQSAYKFFSSDGAKLSIYDEQASQIIEDLPDDVSVTVAPAEKWVLDDYDLVIRSPGLSPNKFKTSVRVSSVTDEFFRKCPAPIIGVTGTKGKGTTASLMSKILNTSGRKTHLLGNIGSPALDALHEISPEDVVIYELSSFQLWDMDKSPHIAVVLMIQPEHLDVHEGFEDYLDAKSNITSHQSEADLVVYHPTNQQSKEIANKSQGSKYRYLSNEAADIASGKLVIAGVEIMSINDFGLLGPHNYENICAALSASWQVAQDAVAAREAISAFKGLEHRLELAGEVDGVKYYNDSFATIPEATIAAMRSFREPEVVILGGSDKRSDYSELAQYIAGAGNVKQIILIGKMAEKIQSALEGAGFNGYQKVEGDMADIVAKCREIAESGDVVVLSPACASFDMFESYKQRGQLFKQAVREL